MDRYRGCGSLLAILFLLQLFATRIECIELIPPMQHSIGCFYGDKQTCNQAGGRSNSCKWCEQTQQCYSTEFAEKVGIDGCNRSGRRHLTEMKECGDLVSKESCASFGHCKWCRSEIVDDGCFGLWEARRIPSQVFDCS